MEYAYSCLSLSIFRSKGHQMEDLLTGLTGNITSCVLLQSITHTLQATYIIQYTKYLTFSFIQKYSIHSTWTVTGSLSGTGSILKAALITCCLDKRIKVTVLFPSALGLYSLELSSQGWICARPSATNQLLERKLMQWPWVQLEFVSPSRGREICMMPHMQRSVWDNDRSLWCRSECCRCVPDNECVKPARSRCRQENTGLCSLFGE